MPAAAKLRSDAKRNRERVFLAAKHAFAEQGGEAGMDEIARRAGVGVGTLYRAFGSRSGLVEAIYADEVDQLEVGAARLSAEAEPWPALTRWLQAYVAAFITKRTMLSELTPLFRERPAVLEDSRRRAMEALAPLLRSAQTAGCARADVEPADLIRLLNGVLVSTAADAERVEVLTSVVLDGLRAPRSGG